jgi:hypothetical protein
MHAIHTDTDRRMQASQDIEGAGSATARRRIEVQESLLRAKRRSLPLRSSRTTYATTRLVKDCEQGRNGRLCHMT